MWDRGLQQGSVGNMGDLAPLGWWGGVSGVSKHISGCVAKLSGYFRKKNGENRGFCLDLLQVERPRETS